MKASIGLLNSGDSFAGAGGGREYIYTYLKEDMTSMVFSPSVVSVLNMSYVSTNMSSEQVERIPWKFCALLYVYCDCFSCYAIHFWFKYLMTLIKQHLNFLWDPVNVPLDHIMSNNGWNELQWEAAVQSGGSAAVCDGSRTRQLNRSHPVSGILPMKWCIKTVLLVQLFHFCIIFRFSTGMACGLHFSWWLKISKKWYFKVAGVARMKLLKICLFSIEKLVTSQ